MIERTLAWFARFRRLTVRYERRLDILLGFHLLPPPWSASASSSAGPAEDASRAGSDRARDRLAGRSGCPARAGPAGGIPADVHR
jgi:hypothetical protein